MRIRITLLALLLLLTGFTFVNAEDAAPTNAMAGMSYPMQKSMDPNVWMKMMPMMMDPSKMMSMENCALCHEGDDLARYAKDFGPMMEPMKELAKAASPHQMASMMNPFMNSMGGMGGMMNPAMYMNMMYPMMGMMGPMMGMMGPMMGGMGGMNMMNPMGMMGPMMGGMGGMGGMNMMNPMGMMGGSGYNNANPMGQMMNPEQYTDWFNQMMKSFTPAQQPANN
ncbi:MAG: hypothetical protein R8G33_00980 [Gammaproteobacteria bacterium]|nr:hypothetical protein [Gammaproteobacteria bacterium]